MTESRLCDYVLVDVHERELESLQNHGSERECERSEDAKPFRQWPIIYFFWRGGGVIGYVETLFLKALPVSNYLWRVSP